MLYTVELSSIRNELPHFHSKRADFSTRICQNISTLYTPHSSPPIAKYRQFGAAKKTETAASVHYWDHSLISCVDHFPRLRASSTITTFIKHS
jgi:hypothetical protein